VNNNKIYKWINKKRKLLTKLVALFLLISVK
jgi:hypothetical protein